MRSLLCLLLLAAALPLSAAMDPIRYTVRFPAPQTHYAEIEGVFPTGGRPRLELFMAVWTPGSYLVREYARNVEEFTAAGTGTAPLPFVKTRKNRWLIDTGGAKEITVRYRLYGREMSVRTNWVERDWALLTGAATFLAPVGELQRPYQVKFELPNAWRKSLTGLPQASGQAHTYTADDFDTLVDSPVLLGNPAVHEFTVEGKAHYLVNQNEDGLWDGQRAVRDLEKLVRENLKLWGSLPYNKYLWLNILSEAGGGLEHKNSTVLMSSRFAMRTQKSYRDWLGLASHEYFHVWNVKRLRPAALGPFDYENETYTRGLWVAEGFTSYYGDLLCARAGLVTREELLEDLSRMIEGLQTRTGRLVQPLEQSSYDAWIKQYRPDENSGNVTISYYTKGAIAGLLLDAKIRHLTKSARSLDDLLRALYAKYSGPRGFDDQDVVRTASEVAGQDLAPWFQTVLRTTKDLDYTEFLDTYGLRFKPADPVKKGEDPKGWLGMATKNDTGRLVVTSVPRDTPAFSAGVNVDDEILAIDGYRVRADGLDKRLEFYRPGQTVEVLVARRDKLVPLAVTLGRNPGQQWRLEVRPEATNEQKQNLQRWLASLAS